MIEGGRDLRVIRRLDALHLKWPFYSCFPFSPSPCAHGYYGL